MKSINFKGQLLTFDVPAIMGVINVNSDSFYEKSRFNSIEAVVEQTAVMLKDGASVIDIGAASSRPGAESKTAHEEWSVIGPVLEELVVQFPDAFISVDTYYGRVAEKAINAGAHLVNDISAFELDDYMLDFISESKTPYVLMHMQGTPKNMQQNPIYDNVTSAILQFFIRKLRILQNKGLKDIIIDPGFGFGKLLADNYKIFRELEVFKMLERPLLVGISRKSMIYNLLETEPEEALNATCALHLQALLKGADILRVHDVKEAKEVITLLKMLKSDN